MIWQTLLLSMSIFSFLKANTCKTKCFFVKPILVQQKISCFSIFTAVYVFTTIHNLSSLVLFIMCGSRKFCQRQSNLDFFVCFSLIDKGREDPNTTISGPSSAHQPNKPAIELLCDLLGDPDQYCLETLYFFVIFQGGGIQTPCPLSGSGHVY